MPATDYTEQGKQRGQERISAQGFQFHMFRVILSVPVRGVRVNSPPPPEERETHVLHAVFEYKTVYTNSPFVLSFEQHATRGLILSFPGSQETHSQDMWGRIK